MTEYNTRRKMDRELMIENLELLEKIKKGEKLDSKDLNSNKSFEYDGLESVIEKHEKWFGGNKNEDKK